jgi:hypothetical protein
MLRITHCLDSQLTDGSKVVSPTHRLRSNSPQILFSCFWYSVLLETLLKTPWSNAAGTIKWIEKIRLISSLSRVVPAYSIEPQPTTLPRASRSLKRYCVSTSGIRMSAGNSNVLTWDFSQRKVAYTENDTLVHTQSIWTVRCPRSPGWPSSASTQSIECTTFHLF